MKNWGASNSSQDEKISNFFGLKTEVAYLKIEDDGPNESQYHRWSSINDVTGVDINQFDFPGTQKFQCGVAIAQKMWPF